MMMVNREVARMVLRNLVDSADSGRHVDLSALESAGLLHLSPLEMEQAATRCALHVKIEVSDICRAIRQTRRNSLILQFVDAGASNRLLRMVFGLSMRSLTRLRKRAGISNPGRPRQLTKVEETAVTRYSAVNPVPAGPCLLRAEWCLGAYEELNIPFMTIHRWVGEKSAEEE